MIVVTGTKRSGTSMWMRVFESAGIPVLGEKFSSNWSETIKDANPNGFYESKLRNGINFTSNPDPVTGFYLSPESTKNHAIKLFIPGLVTSDIAYLDKVLATIRPWNEYSTSLMRLKEMEKKHQKTNDPKPGSLSPELEWWNENFLLLRNFTTRKFPMYLVSYDSVLRDPEATVKSVLAWVSNQELNVSDAVQVVSSSDRTQTETNAHFTPSEGVTPEMISLFEELYHVVDTQKPITTSFIMKLNELDQELKPLMIAQSSS